MGGFLGRGISASQVETLLGTLENAVHGREGRRVEGSTEGSRALATNGEKSQSS